MDLKEKLMEVGYNTYEEYYRPITPGHRVKKWGETEDELDHGVWEKVVLAMLEMVEIARPTCSNCHGSGCCVGERE